MEIIHTEKQPLITSLRNLNPTECCYIRQASMVVNLETGKVKYFNCNIIVQLAACIIAVNV